MVDAAKSLLASEQSPGTKAHSFLEDVLKIEYSYPNAPQLTLVDLPGQFTPLALAPPSILSSHCQ